MYKDLKKNKRTCAFILFGNLLSPYMASLGPARLLILKETIVPARLSKPAPFWILLLVVSKKKVHYCKGFTKYPMTV